jgi:hypothetical protein
VREGAVIVSGIWQAGLDTGSPLFPSTGRADPYGRSGACPIRVSFHAAAVSGAILDLRLYQPIASDRLPMWAYVHRVGRTNTLLCLSPDFRRHQNTVRDTRQDVAGAACDFTPEVLHSIWRE